MQYIVYPCAPHRIRHFHIQRTNGDFHQKRFCPVARIYNTEKKIQLIQNISLPHSVQADVMKRLIMINSQ